MNNNEWMKLIMDDCDCIAGSSASYWSDEAGARVPFHHGQHGGGEDRGEGRGEAAAGQAGHPAGPALGQEQQRPQQGRNAQHHSPRRRSRLRLQRVGHYRRRHWIHPRQEREQGKSSIFFDFLWFFYKFIQFSLIIFLILWFFLNFFDLNMFFSILNDFKWFFSFIQFSLIIFLILWFFLNILWF